jgi:high-affinity iron transporter
MAAFLVMLREGVEAALIVGILLAYLDRLDRPADRRWVWRGTFAAVAVSLFAGWIVYTTIGSLEGRTEEIADGVVALVAAGLLTWMIFWMAGQARAIRGRLEIQVDTALATGGATALAFVAFIAVLREGLESALFLLSTTVGEQTAAAQVVGALLGVAAAVAVGYLIYRGARLVDIRVFFRVTGALIILFASGLVAKAVDELQEAGLIGTIDEHLWSVSFADPATSTLGQFLNSLFGWSTDPSLEMVLAYFLYLIPILIAFLVITRPAPLPERVSAPVEH